MQLVWSHSLDVPRDVDPVDNRSGEFATVLPAGHLAAGAVVAGVSGMVFTARARVARQHHHRSRRERGSLLAAGDRDLTALQWLAQPFDDVAGEERELVEKQGAVVGAADLAGPDPSGASTEHTGSCRRMVGGAERGTCHHRHAGGKSAGQGVDRSQLERLLQGEVGQQGRDPFGERGLSGPLGSRQQQVVSACHRHLECVAAVGHPQHVRHVEVLGAPVAAPTDQPPARRRGDGWGRRNRLSQ